jgi:hypothetical protein
MKVENTGAIQNLPIHDKCNTALSPPQKHLSVSMNNNAITVITSCLIIDYGQIQHIAVSHQCRNVILQKM